MKKLIAKFIERGIIEDTRRKIKKEIKKFNGKILDLGCGEKGSFDYGTLEIVGVDKNKERLDKLNCYKKFVVNVEKRLPFKDREFDVVIFSGVIQYLKNYEKSIKEINRILKPHGKLILATINRVSLFRRFGLINKKPKKEGGEEKIFTEEEIEEILLKNNFKTKRIVGSDFILMPKKLSANLIFVVERK